MKKPWLVLVFLVVLGLGLVIAQEAKPFVYPDAWSVNKPSEAKRGGVFRGSTVSDYRTLNPFVTAESPNIPDALSAGGLVTRNPVNGEWIPYMAESFTIAPNRLSITFNIRRGMKWSDGQAITADDWVTTWRIHTTEAVGSNSFDGFFLGDSPITVTKVSDFVLRMNYPRTDAEALNVASYDPWPDHIFGPVFREKGAEGIKAMWGLNTPPAQIVSSGPFNFDSYRPGERLVLKRNPFFGEWNKDSAGGALPYLETSETLIVKDINAALAAFLAGTIDVFGANTVDHISQIRRAIQGNQLNATIKVNASPSASSQFIVWNWNRASDTFKQNLFRQAKFRQAMSHLVNRQAAVEVVFGGFGTPTFGSIYPVLSQWTNPNAPKFEFNPAQATKLLGELGFTRRNAEGVLIDRAGKALEFNLATNSGNNVREQLARLFADEARKVGVKVNFQPIDFNVLVGQLQAAKQADRPWDAILIGLTGGGLDWPYGGNVTKCDGGLHMYNTIGRCIDPRETQLEALYERGRQDLNLQNRRALASQMQVIEAQLQPVVYIAGPNFHPAWNNRIGGNFPDPVINALYGSRVTVLSFVK